MGLAPQIKEASEIIQQWQPLVDSLVALLQTGAGWLLLVFLIFYFVITKDRSYLFDYFERRERRRLECIDAYLASPSLANSEMAKTFTEIRDAHYFNVATGINAEQTLRIALIDLHRKTSHRTGWRQIRRAFQYIDLDNGNVARVRELTILEKIWYWYVRTVAYLCIFSAACLVLLVFFPGNRPIEPLALGLVGSLGVFIFAFFVNAQNWSADAAESIRKELAKLETPEM